MGTGNPFFDIHYGMWTRLEAVEDLTAAVPAGNRHKFTSNVQEILNFAPPAQGRPELVIVDTATEYGDRVASNAVKILQQWEIWLRGCERDIDTYTTIKLLVTQAMMDWDNATTGLKTITWDTPAGSVRDCHLLKSTDSILNGMDPKKTNGWSCVWVGTTDMWFSHASFIDV